jgi:hypothetical protein
VGISQYAYFSSESFLPKRIKTSTIQNTPQSLRLDIWKTPLRVKTVFKNAWIMVKTLFKVPKPNETPL